MGEDPGVELMVPVDGGELWAEDTRCPAPPVVLLHPGWGDARIWQPVVERLGGRARAVRYDVRGYHRSAAARGSFSQLDDLCTVLEFLAVPPAVVVGHSGGGGTAIGLALAEPARVRALLLLAPGVPDYPWPVDDPFITRFSELMAARDREGLTRLGLQTWAPVDDGPATRDQIRSAVTAFLTEGAREQPPPSTLDRLAEIKVPATLLVGSREYPMVAECAATIAAGIPGCRTVTVPGADHMLPLRVPDLVVDHIISLVG